jgi:signal transduction histidine kinase
MHRVSSLRRGQFLAAVSLVLLVGTMVCAAPQPSPEVVTNILQLRRIAGQNLEAAYGFRLEGDVWWANAARGRFVLRDPSGAAALELELAGPFPQAGQRVRIAGIGTVKQHGSAIRLGAKGPVVDNDGVHGIIAKQGTVHLDGGNQPIRVEWFNGVEGLGLEVAYEGPGVSRQAIPASALWRFETGTSNLVNGSDYRAYEVTGNVLPNFAAVPVLTNGIATNFTLTHLPRREQIGLVFTGFIQTSQTGLYTFHLKSDDGSRLFVGQPSLRAEVIGAGAFPTPQRLTVGQVVTEADDRQWSEVEGRVAIARKTPTGLQLELTAGAAQLLVELGDDSGIAVEPLVNARIRALGFCQGVHTTDGQQVAGVLLVPGSKEIEIVEATSLPDADLVIATNGGALKVLSTAGEVHRLKREEAQRGYPVRLRGVVTSVLPEHQSFTIQDPMRGLYVEDYSAVRAAPPEVGEFLEVEGTTDPSLFAPIVKATRVRSLGAGRLPEPVRPMWDQLNNGSLDAQQVELQGIVTEVQTNGLTLLAPGGIINVTLRLRDQAINLSQYENALVRIRGCLLASWDYLTHQVKMGNVRIYHADILVEQPPPADLFSSPLKTAAELLQFDPQAGAFQRVRVSGQVTHVRDTEHFLQDAERGLRFLTKHPSTLEAGSLVEVVGFPDLLGSASPVLREAVIRKTGAAPLPEPRPLSAENLIRADHDATRVKVEGLLVNVSRAKAETVLELQNGVRTFVARLEDAAGALPSLAAGSRLELTGIYAGLGGNRAAGQDIAAFELLVRAPADIRVLARPPWWTLKRLLVSLGVLACVLAVAALWITQLHRQVEERTAQLGAQIQERQRVEHQRALEEERTRIAQDLHDELGSGITEMSMLAARAKSASAPDEKRERHLDQVGSKARDLVTALDEIVWAMNPRHDSLASLVSYFSLYADRFLGLANIAWQLEGPTGDANQSVDSRRRHQLFLAFKEALTNVVRHSGATEVRIGIRCEPGRVHMSVADNGRGLPAGLRTEDMDGLNNMRRRIEKLGGHFEISGEPTRGTLVRFDVPADYPS